MTNKWWKIGRGYLLAAMLGALLVLSFAPYDVFPLAILAPAGLLALMLNATARRAAYLGFSFGLGMFGFGVYWVYISVHEFGDVPPILAGLVTALLIAILALFPAGACYVTNRYFPNDHSRKLYLAFPAIWLVSDWIRSWVACGFTWLFLGYSQTNSPLRGYAPILSVYGVTLAVLISSGLIVSAALHYRKREMKWFKYNLLSLAGIWILGFLLSLIPWTSPKGEPMRVSLVQGNIPQSIKWSRDYLDLSYQRYRELTLPLFGKSKLIVWPEAAIPNTLQNSEEFINEMDARAVDSKTQLILGIPVANPVKNSEGYYNAVIALGQHRGFYFKRRLVPYGEYVPFQWLSSRILNFMDVPMSNMIQGDAMQPSFKLNGVRINASICFEITFPELIYTRDPTVGMLITVTNDAWFGDSIAQPQHLQMGIMRAIELGRPVLFDSNDGITAIIGPTGEIQAQAPQHVIYVLTGDVQPMAGYTPWMTNDMDPLIVIIVSFLVASRRQAKKSAASTTQSTNQ